MAVVTAAWGDAGGRDGSGSRADMKCLLRGKLSNDHSFPFALSPTRTRFINIFSMLAWDLMAGTDLFNFAAMR
jgi:hypothetical protein